MEKNAVSFVANMVWATWIESREIVDKSLEVQFRRSISAIRYTYRSVFTRNFVAGSTKGTGTG